MTAREQQLILLLRAHLMEPDSKDSFPLLSEDEWMGMYNLSVSHGVPGLAYEGVCTLGLSVPKRIKERWQNTIYHDILYYHNEQNELLRVIEALKQNDVCPVLLRGFSSSCMYPIPELRVIGDIDFFESERFYEAALCLEKLGYRAEKTVSIHHVEFLFGKHMIELHRMLFTPVGLKGFDKLIRSFDLTDAGFSSININGVSICVLPEQDQIKMALFHILKRFISSDVSLRRLCDILMLFKSERCTDWSPYYELISDCGMGDILSGIVSILVYEFGLSPELTKGIPLMKIECEKKFADDFFSSFDKKTGANNYYFTLGAGGALHMLKQYLKAVRSDLLIKYPYCRSKPLLRPVAFVHAHIDYFLELLSKTIKLAKKG